jgi:transposase
MSTTSEVLGPERRRRWTAAEKARIVEESLAVGANAAEVARCHDIHRNQLYAWRWQARVGTLVRSRAPSAVAPDSGFSRVVVAPEGTGPRAQQHEPSGATAIIEVVLRNGRVLRLTEEATPGRVAALADALEGCGR